VNRRERIEATVAGQSPDRPPVALWRHFPGDDQRTADLAQSIVIYQQHYQWDFVTITPASTYAVADYGVQSAWAGAPSGDRAITKHAIHRSLAWTELRTLDAYQGEFGKHMECIRLVHDALGAEVPLLMTIYSPLAQAERLAGGQLLRRHMRTRGNRLRSGLNTLTENTLRFVKALARSPISGIYYVIEHADYDAIAESEYAIFGLPYDEKILSELAAAWWLNIAQLKGSAPMFHFMQDKPVQAINWQTYSQNPGLPQGKSLVLGAVCGGLSSAEIHDGTPSAVRNTAREALQLVNNRRLILTAEGAVPITAPLSNLRAVRSAVDTAKGDA
jgi:uroporphyrinogen decarboxylase